MSPLIRQLRRMHHNFLIWRYRHISNRNFILLISLMVGICGGVAAIILKASVHWIRHFIMEDLPSKYTTYLFFFFPLIGILLTVAYKYYMRGGKLGHGLSNLLYAISRKSSLVERDKMYSHVISSALTVGFGGSAGVESPIVTTGAAIGSNLGRIFHLGYKKRTLLIGCGAAAAIGGMFNSPVAGVIFSLEVLLLELAIPAFIPLLISAVTATIISKYVLGDEILFNFTPDVFEFREIPLFVLLAIACGFISLYFSRILIEVEKVFEQLRGHWQRAVIGGLGLGMLIFVFPPLYGEGYEAIRSIQAGKYYDLLEHSLMFEQFKNDWLLLAFVGAMIFVKVFATSVTISAGGNGGVFAPSLFIGGLLGFFIAHAINVSHILPYPVSVNNFTLVGMAGVMAGLMHAPLTAIFLIAEITSGYMLLIPLIIVSAISYATATYIEPHSLYTRQLALRGHLHFHDKDKAVLNSLRIHKLIERDFVQVLASGKLRDLIDAVTISKRNIFPVVDEKGELKGVILLDDIRGLMFKTDKYDKVLIKDLMHAAPASIDYEESMEDVMVKFDKTGEWNLPVVRNGLYEGFLSKSKIFSHYRHLLKSESREEISIIE